MAYLDDIVMAINNGIKWQLSAFPTASYEGVVYPIAKKEGKSYQYLPAIVDSNGEVKWVTFDDLKELIIYHRIISSTYTPIKKESYGDGYEYFQHNYELDLVVMSDRKKTKVTPDVLEAAIASNIISKCAIPGLQPAIILTVSANHNSKSLFTQEFSGLDYYLKPEHIFFSIRYRIELRYQKGCLSLCQCN